MTSLVQRISPIILGGLLFLPGCDDRDNFKVGSLKQEVVVFATRDRVANFVVPLHHVSESRRFFVDVASSCGCGIPAWREGDAVPTEGVSVRILPPASGSLAKATFLVETESALKNDRFRETIELKAHFFPGSGVITPKILRIARESKARPDKFELSLRGLLPLEDWGNLRFIIGGEEIGSAITSVVSAQDSFGIEARTVNYSLTILSSWEAGFRSTLEVRLGSHLLDTIQLQFGQQNFSVSPSKLVISRSKIRENSETMLEITVSHDGSIKAFIQRDMGRMEPIKGEQRKDSKTGRFESRFSIPLGFVVEHRENEYKRGEKAGEVVVIEGDMEANRTVIPVIVF